MISNPKAYQPALEEYRRGVQVFSHLTTGTIPREKAEAELRDLAPAGLYEHWKSKVNNQKYYLVLGVTFDSGAEKNEATKQVTSRPPQVSYASLYHPYAGNLVYRPLLDEKEGFASPINRPEVGWNYVGPRFVLLKTLSYVDIGQLWEKAAKIAKFKDRADALAMIETFLT